MAKSSDNLLLKIQYNCPLPSYSNNNCDFTFTQWACVNYKYTHPKQKPRSKIALMHTNGLLDSGDT